MSTIIGGGLFLILCIGMHVVMMKMMGHGGHGTKHDKHSHDNDNKDESG